MNLAMAAGGWQPEGHPAFAIARADRKEVQYRIDTWRGRWLRFDSSAARATSGSGSLLRTVPLDAMPVRSVDYWKPPRAGSAMVPLIPADVREEGFRNALYVGTKRWFILWEAVWTPVPPRDPILLEHIAGSLYSVLATWELTELERALMVGRLIGSLDA